MNYPLYKMLRFELKSRFKIRLWNIIIVVLPLSYFFYMIGQAELLEMMGLLFSVLTWITIPYIYQESNQQDTMQLYHLIPISLNVKFISKLLMSLIIFPLYYTGLILFCFYLSNMIFGQPNSMNPFGSIQHSFYPFFGSWIFVSSFYTMTTIYFKTNKILYGVLSLIGSILLAKFIQAIILWLFEIKETPNHLLALSSDSMGEWTGLGLLALSAVFYFISYRLFKRRQL